ncbi:MAG TPA: hypothetical protein VF813_08930, partial [Anaerolineaceae bacterium]
LPENRQLIQVTQHIENSATREREIRSLEDAVKSVKAQSALILSETNGDKFDLQGVPVEMRSIADWLVS